MLHLWLLSYILGILAAQVLSVPPTWSLLPVAVTAGAAALPRFRLQRRPLLLLACFFLSLGWTRFHLDESTLLSPYLGREALVAGEIAEEPRNFGSRLVFPLEVSQVNGAPLAGGATETIQVKLYPPTQGSLPDLRYGQRLLLRGRLKEPPAPGNPGEFDYRAYLFRQGIHCQLTVAGDTPVTVTGKGGWALLRAANDTRRDVSRAVANALPQREAAILLGILFGDTDGVSAGDQELFRITGTAHAFAVSGANLGVLSVTLLFLFNRLGLSRPWQAALTSAALFYYSLMTGFPLSVQRAFLMAIGAMAAYLLQRDKAPLVILSAAALAILAVHPLALWEAGFQLTMAASWGILYLYPLLDHPLERRWGRILPPFLRGVAVVPAAAQLAVLPIVLYHFGLFSAAGWIANPLAGLLIALATHGGFLALPFLYLFPPLAEALLRGTGLAILGMVKFLEWVRQWPGAVWYGPSPPLWLVALYYGAWILWREKARDRLPLWLSRRLQDPRAWLPPLVGAATLLLAMALFPEEPALSATFIDVGQGDAILITTPQGRHVLVDGGGLPPQSPGGESFDVGKEVLLPFLQRQGVTRLAAVVSTHPDHDHIGGLAAIVENLPAQLLILSPEKESRSHPAQLHLENLARQRDIPLAHPRRGDAIALEEGVLLEVLHPGPPLAGTTSDLNNNALVLKVAYQGQSLLLTADLEEPGLTDLARSGEDLRCTVLKLPHHGSRHSRSEAFLAGIGAPRAVILSVGTNLFGHPHREVTDPWTRQGTPLFRTDQDGAVTVSLTPSGMTVRTHRTQKEYRFDK